MQERNKAVDIFKGVLIMLVVIGHSFTNIIHHLIFLFHMPIFFILSGLFLKKHRFELQYIMRRIKSLLIPYLMFGMLDCLLCKRSVRSLFNLVWGGRYISGTYWYATCFLGAVILFAFLLKHFSDRSTKLLIFAGGGISIIESQLLTGSLGDALVDIVPQTGILIKLMNYPGIPWNLDVALLALVYLVVGYYNKERIHKLLNERNRKLDLLAAFLTIILAVFCFFNYRNGEAIYYFDMKLVYYHELVLAVAIPCAFGIVIARAIWWLGQIKLTSKSLTGIAYLGQMTIPIMFMHVPLNTWSSTLGYGRIVYVLIGVCIPVLFTVIFNRFTAMRKLFGLPAIKGYSE